MRVEDNTPRKWVISLRLKECNPDVFNANVAQVFFQDFNQVGDVILHEVFRVRTHSRSKQEAREKLAAFDLTDVIGQMRQPALFVTGDQDLVVPPEQTARQAELAPNGLFVNYAGGGHAVPNLPYLWRPLVTDWMRQQLG